ncbi:DUF4159 domain-containing protein [Pseudahrensia aquimaris]|uniref:DUF4159 domain-containing protein n=1 Tax=Pseudahrensia aquimaris TaxID=744461 RepID=A0ABW3FDJ3_9HYPH
MSLFGLTFASPLLLLGLLALPAIWWLLRLTPPRPREEVFPPTRILEQITKPEETPAQSPWWLTLLRLVMAGLVILALADPIRNAITDAVSGEGPVLVVVDDGWTSGLDWQERVNSASTLIEEAGNSSRPIALAFLSESEQANLAPSTADAALARLSAAQPTPLKTNAAALAEKLREDATTFGTIAWLSSGLSDEGTTALNEAIGLKQAGEVLYFGPALDNTIAVTRISNDTDAMVATLARPASSSVRSGIVSAYDIQGRSLASAEFAFETDASSAEARFVLPAELRNDFVRIDVDGLSSAGAVQLLDERFRRRNVGLISGENADRSQPLLSPLYYISRALAPFSQIREAQDANLLTAITQLIEERVSTLILADIGTLPEDAEAKLREWLNAGGVLIRFAGPRLAAANDDPLIPVRLRQGDRNLGGTLTWGTPQRLSTFDPASPFSGVVIPEDVTINRQVLAEPDIDLEAKTWASLEDGTPLVTAAREGDGWIVLFHVTADASWSNLPLSGAFVDMLRRIVAVSNGALSQSLVQQGGESESTQASGTIALPPLRNLDGFGVLGGAAEAALPLTFASGTNPTVGLENPPGLYGSSDAFVALNLFQDGDTLTAFDTSTLPANAEQRAYQAEAPFNLKPWLLAVALGLFALDCLAVLWMAGAFQKRLRPAVVSIAAALMLVVAQGERSFAQDTSAEFEASLKTRLAFVRTGIAELDTISEKGLIGLTDFIASRTSLEPAEPMGVDIGTDELAFFPLLYWPVSAASPVPSTQAMARVDAFMKQGGTVLFDTRDQLSGGFGGNSVSAATMKLREILATLDIPPLEPVPENHVLTRAFYLLDVFPGRYLDGNLWVEASADESSADRPTRSGDGVSTIMITSNDFAGAWAVEASGAPTLPIVPPNPTQRVYAYRTGVNIVMYTLTGNYKADQVHIPALLERLGQ